MRTVETPRENRCGWQDDGGQKAFAVLRMREADFRSDLARQLELLSVGWPGLFYETERNVINVELFPT